MAGNGLLTRIKDAAKHVANMATASTGRVFIPSSVLDGFRQTVADRLDLRKLASLLRNADAGDLASGCKLFEEMEEKDAHLRSVAETRRLALTGLDWEVVSAADVYGDRVDKNAADEAADKVREALTELEYFDEALEHLSTGIGSNIAVAELVWQLPKIVDIVPIPSWRLRTDPREPGVIRVITEQNSDGVPADPIKFVVHHPHGASFFPFTQAIGRSQAFVYLAKQLAMIDWTTFCSIFGMPIRTGTYKATASQEEKDELARMMRNLGANAWGVFSEAIQFQVQESSQRGIQPYEALLNWCDRKQSILFLGGNLTTDTTGGTGTHAAGAVQNEVREDRRNNDIRRESRAVTRQIIAPLCAAMFPSREMPCPIFQRIKPEIVDRSQEADLLGKAQHAGMEIPLDWAHKRLGIPKAKDGEEILTPSLDAFGEAMREGIPPTEEETPSDRFKSLKRKGVQPDDNAEDDD